MTTGFSPAVPKNQSCVGSFAFCLSSAGANPAIPMDQHVALNSGWIGRALHQRNRNIDTARACFEQSLRCPAVTGNRFASRKRAGRRANAAKYLQLAE